VAEKLPLRSLGRNRRKYAYCLLFVMILANIAIRYPTDHAVPYGSDTFSLLGLSRQLAEDGSAGWTLTPMSYFGLYPLSYPSGVPFSVAEFQVMSDAEWNTVPLIFSLAFAILFVLGGFILFRQFRLGDVLSAFLAGLMALSPVFVYFTFQEITGRGFVLPILLLSLYVIFWSLGRMSSRIIVFLLLMFGTFSMHRSSFMILVMELIGVTVLFVVPLLPRAKPITRASIYVSILIIAILFLIWPFVPGLNDLFSDIPEVAFSYRMGVWEFRTGMFFEGESFHVLLGNLMVNYVGSMGLALLLLPFGFIAMIPSSKHSLERDVFPLIIFAVFAPMMWQAMYMQLMLLPFAYLMIGLAISRRDRVKALAQRFKGLLRIRTKRSGRSYAKFWNAALAVFLVLCLVFSTLLFAHRMDLKESTTGLSNWPEDPEVNIGLYAGDIPFSDEKSFVSASGLLDRRIRWYSDMQSPVSDSSVLEANGYLNATADDFTISVQQDNYLYFLFAFFDFKRFYELNASYPYKYRYDLSYNDIYGFFRLYYMEAKSAYASPPISTAKADIALVVEIISMGDTTYNLYMGEGPIHSNFLREVSSKTYIIFENDELRMFLAADPRSG
jgi:hypothetical protein